MSHSRIRILFAALAFLGLASASHLEAQTRRIPAELPDPDGMPGDPTKPVQVYILAGQSNMVGMGDVSGAKNRYTGVFLTPDPAAPKGPLAIYKAGNYRIRPLRIHLSAEPDARVGATASMHPISFDPLQSAEAEAPAKVETVALGVVRGTLPSLLGPYKVIVRGFLEVPETGRYSIHPGYGLSSYNTTKLEGRVIYRKTSLGGAVVETVTLEAGKRYAFETAYQGGGSTAFWLSQEELLGKGDLESVVKRDGMFPHLVDDEGEWTVRRDVWFQEARLAKDGTGSLLSATSNGRSIGPELGFGHVLGEFHDEQVLLIKTAQGNRSLGYDFRPPSSGRNDPDSEWESAEFKLMIESVQKTLARIDEIVPGYQGQGYEIAGFAWWQGHKDGGTPELVAEYEQNLVHLIQDVRAALDAPDMPAVIATVGFEGYDMSGAYLEILNAQMALGDPKKHPAFAGKVASVDTRAFWREVDDSPREQGYHYNRNAETYLRVGDALGRAMVRLRGGEAASLPQAVHQQTAELRQESAAPLAQDENVAREALAPMLLDGVVPAYLADPRYRSSLLSEARGERPQRPSQFLRGAMFGLTNIFSMAGNESYDWHVFGPDLRSLEWEYLSFDPIEELPKEKGSRFRAVSWPKGMERWFEPDFDAGEAGWRRGLAPFGQLDGKLEPLSSSCASPFCGCGTAPNSLWEKEVLMIRGAFEIPPLEADRRYRLVVGGSAHVNAGEGFAIYVNGKLLAQSNAGVGKRQGGQPRGAPIFADFRDEFQGGAVTIAVYSFLRYNNPRGPLPPRGHLSVWMEEAQIPPLEHLMTDGR